MCHVKSWRKEPAAVTVFLRGEITPFTVKHKDKTEENIF